MKRGPVEVGQKYGRLTVLEFHSRGGNAIKWQVKCDCGTIKIVRGCSLLGSHTQSCGCLAKERKQARLFGKPSDKRKAFGESCFYQLYRIYARGATKRGLPFQLSFREFMLLVKQPCAYCGTPPSQIYTKVRAYGHAIYNGIDRTNNNEGYTTNNSVACCCVCNRAKSDLSSKEFLNYLQRLVEFQTRAA